MPIRIGLSLKNLVCLFFCLRVQAVCGRAGVPAAIQRVAARIGALRRGYCTKWSGYPSYYYLPQLQAHIDAYNAL
jgi:hypothetical protein